MSQTSDLNSLEYYELNFCTHMACLHLHSEKEPWVSDILNDHEGKKGKLCLFKNDHLINARQSFAERVFQF